MFTALKKKISVLAKTLALAVLKRRITIYRTILIAVLTVSSVGVIGLLELPNMSLQKKTWSPTFQKIGSSKINKSVLQTELADGQTDRSNALFTSDFVSKTRVIETYGKLPLRFEVNEGQTDSQVKFISRGSGYSLFLTPTETVLALGKPSAEANKDTFTQLGDIGAGQTTKGQRSVLRMKLLGANPDPKVIGSDELPDKSNYFIGNDKTKWRTDLSNFARVQYDAVYPGINLLYYGNQRQLEYDFVIAADADPNVIRLAFTGADKLVIDESGDLLLETEGGEVRQHKPIIYQEVGGERKEIAGRYVLNNNQEVGFEVAEYDRSHPLVIDPVLSYSTYLGGSGNDVGYGIAVDSLGNAYVTGNTQSLDFPVVNSMPPGSDFKDIFVTKLNSAGSAIVYSTYIGGSAHEQGEAIAVSSSGSVYITGYTQSANYPRINAIQNSYGGNVDAFITKLNPTGSTLVYSTYLGGSNPEFGHGIAVDSIGNAYVIGRTDSTNFPIANALQPVFGGYQFGGDAFVTKLNPAGSAFIYSTYLGGGSYDEGRGIAVDSLGFAYAVGDTRSGNFPTVNPLQPVCNACGFGTCAGGDAFISKLTPTGSALVYSTFLGGHGGEEGRGIAVDASGNAYVTGSTGSTNFPTMNPFQPTLGPSGSFCPQADAFVTKLNPIGSALIYSTFLGGSGSDDGHGIAVDFSDNAYVTGRTIAPNFPVVNPLQTAAGGQEDAFISKLNPTGSALVYSTYLGGSNVDLSNAIAVDTIGNAYVTGNTWSLNFPTINPFQPTFGGGEGDAFVAKIGIDEGPPQGLSISAITPDEGGNTGFVSATVYGSGFANNATVKLVRAGQPDIPATIVTISQNSTVARVRFNLDGKAPGVWDVVVTNPDSSSVTFAGAFTVEAGGAPEVWADIIGRDEFRPGRPQTYYIAFGNRGNVDGTLLPLIISIPISAQYELGFNFLPVRQPVAGETFDFSQIPAHYQTKTEKIIPLLIGYVPAGRSDFLKIRVTGGNEPLQLLVRASPPTIFYSASTRARELRTFADLYTNNNYDTNLTIPNLTACLTSVAVNGASCGFGLVVPANCASAASQYLGALGLDAISSVTAGAANNYSPSSGVISLTGVAGGQVVVAAQCATNVIPGVAQVAGAVNCGFAANNISSSCVGFDVFTEISRRLIPVFSHDPNGKIGSAGVGTGQYISGQDPLRYSIYFENIASATAPAQDVVITDQLDVSKLDFDTFSLGPISFGVDKIVVPPAGLSKFTRDIDLRPQTNLIVRIEAKLNKTTGILSWRFTSLDPATGLPPKDPNAGFLPPNVIAPQGEGQVLFTVRPKENLATGTEIRNRAIIIFDNNAPILTPEWLNTIDYSQPTSQVLPLTPMQSSNSFTVNWSGSDSGSGIESYTIFVSENGGQFNVWRQNTTATSGIFTGSADTIYAFYSVARDKTGNQESAPPTADATTRILGPTAASVTIGGRVVSGKGTGVVSARVYLIDQNGATRTTLTSPFGYYRFDEVSVGQTYIFSVTHKRYQFDPQVLNVTEELYDLDFVALPQIK